MSSAKIIFDTGKSNYESRYSFNIFEHHVSFIEFVILCIIYTVLGIIIGGLFEIASSNIDKKYNYIASLVFQIGINILFLSIMRFYIFPLFVIQLQTLTIGLLFSATYFGVQLTMYSNSLKLLRNIISKI